MKYLVFQRGGWRWGCVCVSNRGAKGWLRLPELALLVGKKRSEFSSDVQRRQTGWRKGFLKVRSKSNRKHSLLTVWSKNECRGGIWHAAWREGGEKEAQGSPQRAPAAASYWPWVYGGRNEGKTRRKTGRAPIATHRQINGASASGRNSH